MWTHLAIRMISIVECQRMMRWCANKLNYHSFGGHSLESERRNEKSKNHLLVPVHWLFSSFDWIFVVIQKKMNKIQICKKGADCQVDRPFAQYINTFTLSAILNFIFSRQHATLNTKLMIFLTQNNNKTMVLINMYLR